jgi:DNA invertase Pin-like site-specific DNA recombinase
MTPKAYSYLRFSTPEQSKGDSRRRQTEAAEAYAARHGLVLDTSLTFQDLGVSAYRGKNAETGRLGDFKRAVEDGLVAPGSLLLVESLDRISRQAARKALRVLEDIVEAGVVVVTMNDGRSYTRENLDTDSLTLMLALLTFIRGHEESATKASRLRAAWEGKRRTATDKPLTSICPAWLRLDGGRFVVIEDRAAIVRRIFEEAAAGAGLHGIADGLNRDRVPTFGEGKRKAAWWHRSYVAKVVGNHAVVGTMTPHVVSHEGDTKTRKALEPVPAYFPAVVSEDLFQRVQALRYGDHRAAPKTNAAGVQSMLAGLAECAVCGATMTRVAKGPRGGRPRLVCTASRAGKCEGPSVALDDVEAALVGAADRITSEAPVAGDELQGQLDRMDALMDALQTDAEAALEDWRRDRTEGARRRMTDAERGLDAARKERDELVRLRAATNGAGVARRLAELRDALTTEPTDRTRANAALRQVLGAVVVDVAERTATLRWLSGGTSVIDFQGFAPVPGGWVP